MSDTTKQPLQTNFAPMVITGLGSSAIGDKIGDALSQIVSWFIAIQCKCAPPSDVISAFHTLCISVVVGIAFFVHSRFINRQT